ncbi:histidinol-phosphate aminotransferase family protein, partial [archaeon]|nr:histidinol-phosphate aminotransferase family protein [archaeon]
MIKISNLTRKEIESMPTKEYAPEEEQLNVKSNMALNINPFKISEKVLKKLKDLPAFKIHHYYPENHELLKLIAKYMDVSVENVMIGDGCDGCIEMIAHTFIQQGDLAIIPVPTFHRYEFHTKMMGGNVVFVPMQNFAFSAGKILKESKNAKLIFLCNPSNPTGIEIDKKEIIDLLEKFNNLVIIDEALADATDIKGTDLLKKYPNLIIVRSFSKTFGLASCRIGYVVADKQIINQIKKVSSPFKVNGIGQELAIAALKDEEHISKSREFLEKERNYLFKELEKLNLPCTKSITTNFLIDVEKINSEANVVAKKLEEKGVLVTEASVF